CSNWSLTSTASAAHDGTPPRPRSREARSSLAASSTDGAHDSIPRKHRAARAGAQLCQAGKRSLGLATSASARYEAPQSSSSLRARRAATEQLDGDGRHRLDTRTQLIDLVDENQPRGRPSQGLTKRWTNASAASAISRQPWSMVNEWPRPLTSTIS